jgi:hypothetical protein
MSFAAFDKWKFHLSDLDQLFFNKSVLMVGSSYVGGVTLFLVAFFFLRKMSALEKTMVFIGVYALISSFGSNTPIGELNYSLPLLDTIREQSRHLVIFQFMLMIFMALGIDKFSELKQRQNTSRERFFLHACLLTLFLYAVLGTILGRLTLNEMVLVLLFVFIAYFIRVPQRFDKSSFLLVTTVSSVVAVLFSFMSAPWIATQSYSTSVYKTTKMEAEQQLSSYTDKEVVDPGLITERQVERAEDRRIRQIKTLVENLDINYSKALNLELTKNQFFDIMRQVTQEKFIAIKEVQRMF